MPVHTLRGIPNILRIHNLIVLQWPARSLDLPPIEHLWDHFGRQVREGHDVNNIRDLERALQAEWVRIPLEVIRKLICSMRSRCLAVLAATGGHTRLLSLVRNFTPDPQVNFMYAGDNAAKLWNNIFIIEQTDLTV